MPQHKKIDYLVLRPQPADLSPFKKQVATRIRHQLSAILGNIGEKMALDYLESQGYEVCKIDDHAMMGRLCDLLGGHEKQQSSLRKACEHKYRIPTIDLHARWKGAYHSGFCRHIEPFLAKKVWECYYSHRQYSAHFQFLDLLAHKDGKHYAVEVKTNKGRVRKEQVEFMHSLQKLGLETMVIRVNIDSRLLTQDLL